VADRELEMRKYGNNPKGLFWHKKWVVIPLVMQKGKGFERN